MPPKGRRSGSSNWYTCEACGVILSQRDVQQHNNGTCPPNETEWDYAFIKDSVLYSYLEHSSVSDVPDVKSQEKQFLVYLSQSAMQLCRFEIGEQIVLTLNNDSIIRTVWPTADRSLTSVTITPVESGVNQRLLKENCRIKVQKLSDKPLPASFIVLTTSSDISSESLDQLTTMAKQLYSGKLLRRGLELNVPFYGRNVDLIVKEIKPMKCAIDSLEERMENININKASSTEQYLLVVDTSKWTISLKVKNCEKEVKVKSILLSDIGGYKELIQELTKSISLVLKRTSSSSHLSSSMGILLYGPNGVGKTFLSEALANEMHVPVVKINSGELFSKFYGETELRLRSLFTEAKDKSPSIIILDNVDTLCPKRGGTEQERRVISYLLTLLDSLTGHRVVVLATTSQINLIDTSLRRPGRLDCETELPIPSVNDRYEILKVLLAQWTVEDLEVMQVASAAHGYVAADLQSLVTRAVMRTVSLDKSCVESSDLCWALGQTKPSAMREVMVQVPNVKWTDIGGMDDLKLKLQQAIDWPLRHPEAFTRLGINPPRGVLMYGPPGCSKTMIAKALATESKLNFLSIKGSELFSKWVGESEKAVQSLFKKARAVAPSIVFLDELDALGGERGGANEGSNVQERVLAQLLTEMDGVEPLGNVNIVAATNRPDRIDKALLRPGRLDRMVYVPLPDLATRICILQLQLVKMPVARDIVIDDLALKTEGYSGAEVVAVCHEAAMSALQEDFNVSEVCERHFVSALAMVKPRTPQSLLKLYETYSKP
uniref:AAA+ ATPase domain-containing protein n=2 Tax=Graphocephala atropunctata TaxID=36148 RepID=A0A1B6KMP5_9HEMI